MLVEIRKGTVATFAPGIEVALTDRVQVIKVFRFRPQVLQGLSTGLTV